MGVIVRETGRNRACVEGLYWAGRTGAEGGCGAGVRGGCKFLGGFRSNKSDIKSGYLLGLLGG
jgi:hypothetical protein